MYCGKLLLQCSCGCEPATWANIQHSVSLVCLASEIVIALMTVNFILQDHHDVYIRLGVLCLVFGNSFTKVSDIVLCLCVCASVRRIKWSIPYSVHSMAKFRGYPWIILKQAFRHSGLLFHAWPVQVAFVKHYVLVVDTMFLLVIWTQIVVQHVNNDLLLHVCVSSTGGPHQPSLQSSGLSPS